MLVLEGQRYFEDIQVGETGFGLGRTIDYADVILFGNIAGDFNPVHFDFEFSKKSMFGKPLAPGLSMTAMLGGMFIRTPFGAATTKTILEMTEIRELKYANPVFYGDTITMHFEVIGKEEEAERTGNVVIKFTVYNQKDELCQVNTRVYRVAKRGYDFEGIAQRGDF